MPSPNPGSGHNSLYGIAVVSGGDIWAVGYTGSTSQIQTLTEHWNGSAWSVVPSPNAGSRDDDLYQVAAISGSDVWAVGDYYTGTAYLTLVENYAGPCSSPSPTPTVTPTSTSTNGTPSIVPSGTVTAVGTGTAAAPSVTAVSTSTPTSVLSTPTTCPIQFRDVLVGSTFYPFIRCLACLGVINGYPDGTFKPNNSVTRGQLSKIVSNSAGFQDTQTVQMFQDVPIGSTFFQYVGRLASRGYIGGYPCGRAEEPCVPPASLPYFRTNNNATRGQISKIVSNAAGFADPPTGQQFQDVPVGSTYYTFTYRLISRGVMSGYPCGVPPGGVCVPPTNLPYFRPNNNATRGQTSKIVANTFFPDCQTP